MAMRRSQNTLTAPPEMEVNVVRAAAGEPAADAAECTVAVLVCHGMGQQVEFETLDSVAKALSEREAAFTGSEKRQVQTGFVRLDGKRLARAELTLTTPDRRATRRVHVYESYWAPLMEGQVGALDVTRFLFGAGFAGIRHAWTGSFDRWMLNRRRELAIPWSAFPFLLIALAIVSAAVVLYTALGFVVAARIGEALLGTGWRGASLAQALAGRLTGSPLLLSLLVIPALAFLKQRPERALNSAPPYRLMRAAMITLAVAATAFAAWQWRAAWAGARLDWRTIGIVVAAVVALLAAGWLTSRSRTATKLVLSGVFAVVGVWTVVAAVWIVGDVWAWVPRGVAAANPAIPALVRGPQSILFLGCSVALCVVIRWYYVQFMGDVAAYVSSHTVNRFSDVRNRIKAVGREVAQAVYCEKDAATGKPMYDYVLVVGHSLGSVVAYDTLGRMLNEETEVKGVSVEKRTLGLVTFGSPLDKTAFIFRTQIRDAEVREALAAVNQPLIQPAHASGRQIRWINLHSPMDPVSGGLDFYDPALTDTDVPAEHRRVENYVDPDANLPAVAHVQYWNNPLLADVLHALVTGREPDVARSAARDAAAKAARKSPSRTRPLLE